MNRRIVVGLALATFVVFAPALKGPLQFDDIDAIARNASVQPPASLWASLAPPARTAVAGRPVVNLSFAINNRINAALGIGAPTGLRAVNIALHILTGLLLLCFLRQTLRSERVPESVRDSADTIALVATAFWLLHPIQTEAVDYIVQRTELLVSCFYVLTLCASVRAWDAAGRNAQLRWYAVAVIACLLGMGSKEVMVTAPIAVILWDRAFRADTWSALRRNTDRLWLYGALLLTWIPLLLMSAGAREDSAGFASGMPWHVYLRTQGWAILHYLRLTISPDALSFDYGMRPVLGVVSTIGLIALAAGAISAIVAWKRHAWVAFWATWFYLALAPSSSVIPIRTEVAAERRFYLALAPLLVLVAIGTLWLLRRPHAKISRRGLRFTIAFVLVLFGLRTAQRSWLYRNPEALWRDAVAKVPGNARAYDNLAAVIVANPARRDEGEALWRQAIAIDSTYIPAFTNLADLEIQGSRDAEARGLLERAVAINPDAEDASLRYGGLLIKLGENERGVPFLQRAMAVQPTEDGMATLANAYLSLGRYAEAEAPLRHVLAINPTRGDAVMLLGLVLAQLGRSAEAVPYLEAIARSPQAPPQALAHLALAYAETGRADQALSVANRAISLAGTDARAYVVLGKAMLLLNRAVDAEWLLADAVRYAPKDTEAVALLGAARARRK